MSSPPVPSPAYRALLRVGVGLAPWVAAVHHKARRSLEGRRGATERIIAWAAARDPSRPLVWFHAPSVGEGLQAEAVLRAVRRRHSDWAFLYTFFSPSAEPLARRLPVDFAEYLPWDRPSEMRRLLEATRPSTLAFVKLDVWPELACQAAGRGTAVALVAGTVSPVSSRLRWPARSLLTPGYRALTAVGAVSETDGGRLRRLGVPAERITVTGDPRFDAAAERVAGLSRQDAEAMVGGGAEGAGSGIMVAGSTWPADDVVLLHAFAETRRTHPAARLVLVPHEPEPDQLDRIDLAAARLGLATARLSRGEAQVRTAPVAVIDRLGLLAGLYAAGDLSFVGGGFGRTGLHSVLEPAAWGRPVAFGPRWLSSREAGLLVQRGAAQVVVGSPELAQWWSARLTDPSRAAVEGEEALQVVRGGLGGAERNADLIVQVTADPLRIPRR